MVVGIIGAGACGLAAATVLEQAKIKYIILERNNKPGSKILASGNGKCNIMNMENMSLNKELIAFLKANSCPTYFDLEGRVYPLSNSSKTILNVFLDNISKENLKTNELVTKIVKKDSYYIVNDYKYDKLIIATGSSANIVLSKQSSCYDYLSSLNIRLTELKPSLVGFKVKEDVSILKNNRFKVEVSLYNDSKLIAKENGEIIFKTDGLSGICVMNLSYYYNHLKELKDPYLRININPSFSYNQLKSLKYAFPDNTYLYFKDKDIHNLILHIKDTYDIKDAQVICGGISKNDVNIDYSLKLDKNIYVGGELLDEDFPCGGFNLSHAFRSGFIIGENIKNEIYHRI